jgi:hypothetical protein
VSVFAANVCKELCAQGLLAALAVSFFIELGKRTVSAGRTLGFFQRLLGEIEVFLRIA